MTDLRTAARQALEAWDTRAGIDAASRAFDALRAALAQQAEPDAYGYASRLAVAIWGKHYKDTAPHWKPLDDLMGVLTQIDNMTSGLTRLAQQDEPVLVQGELPPRYVARSPIQAEPVEPVAWLAPDGSVRETTAAKSFGEWVWGPDDFKPLYTAPPQRKPLTEEEILAAVGWERAEMYMKLAPNFPVDEAKQETLKNARAVERAVWEKNHG